MRIWSGKRAVKVDVETRETEDAQYVLAPCCIVVQGLVKERIIPPAGFHQTLPWNGGMRGIAGEGGGRER